MYPIRMHTKIAVLALLAVGTIGFACAADKAAKASATSAVHNNDRNLMEQLAQANIAEIEVAKLAQDKSTDQDVKNFARQMQTDHSKALQEVNALAKARQVKLPVTADDKHKAALTRLKALDGAQFDKEYIAQAGVSDHKEAKALVGKISSEARDPDLKALADKLAPTIQHHLEMAEKLHAQR
ncbi:hypothetical protein GCM10007205_01280 [Oxalicibacterium flavum]|uniref:DUF4142 domain-containing protein n=1 Tax=Oxalicibacterium flavum TaxID=179467 RepID=A0A8J2UJF7_9BURK|nr:DUF4142 domain-containing protein [Oxalicibacterium flavum]GGB95769.1 hypothetical protein GCM10007205_01280 [Oxalicibacterium flavum]